MTLVPSIGTIKDTGTPKGRGVFATRTIAANEIIEICPVIKISTPFEQLPPEFQRIVFHWGALAQQAHISALALGYGMIYNHDNPANARYKASPDGDVLIFTAARAIQKDEEITINYNATAGEPVSTADNWFQTTGVAPYIAGPSSEDDSSPGKAA